MGQILLFVLKNPTQVFSILTTIFDLVQSGVTWIDIQEHLGKFDKAMDKAIATKDSSDLENLFNPKPNP